MILRDLGRVAYLQAWQAMQEFTAARTEDTADGLWLCEHEAVFTQGLAGKADHLLAPGDIPVLASNAAARSLSMARARWSPTRCSTFAARATSSRNTSTGWKSRSSGPSRTLA